MKRAFIIHGWTGRPNEHWLPWLGDKLKEKGFEVYLPNMPDTDNPKMDQWVSYLKQEVGTADPDTYFVGHSIGCSAVLRYLERYDEQVGGAILIAPWITLNPESFAAPEDKQVVDAWSNPPLNFENIKNHCSNFVALFSKDDPDVPYEENEPVFRNKLNAKIITEDNKGHFTASSGVTQLPVALKELLRIAK